MRRRPAPLPVVLAALVLLGAAGVGCGGESDEERVRETLGDFGEATARKDYQRLCDELLSRKLIEQVRAAGVPCELALKTGLEDVREPRLQVRDVTITGDRALARVRTTAAGQEPSDDQVRLVREGGDWRIASLATPEAKPGPAP